MPAKRTLQTALRETAEETGLRFAPEELLDLGHFSYRPTKDLHLYAALRERFDPRQCHCSSHFTDLWGRRRPEMDNYEWIAFDRVHRRCARRMAEVLTQRLSLPSVLQQLQQRARPPANRGPGRRTAVGPRRIAAGRERRRISFTARPR